LDEARQKKAEKPRRRVADQVRETEEYRRRLELIQSMREASRWVRPASLSVARVTMMEARGRVEPDFEEWQLALAVAALERRSG
jgi:hypothetical protein